MSRFHLLAERVAHKKGSQDEMPEEFLLWKDMHLCKLTQPRQSWLSLRRLYGQSSLLIAFISLLWQYNLRSGVPSP